jgi:hypothetical protein
MTSYLHSLLPSLSDYHPFATLSTEEIHKAPNNFHPFLQIKYLQGERFATTKHELFKEVHLGLNSFFLHYVCVCICTCAHWYFRKSLAPCDQQIAPWPTL